MTDIVIRNVPDDVVAAIDAKAKRVGLSRTEYLRRVLEWEEGAAGSGWPRMPTFTEAMSGGWS